MTNLPTQTVADRDPSCGGETFEAVVFKVTVEVVGLKPRECVVQIEPGWIPTIRTFRSEVEQLAQSCAESIWQEANP